MEDNLFMIEKNLMVEIANKTRRLTKTSELMRPAEIIEALGNLDPADLYSLAEEKEEGF